MDLDNMLYFDSAGEIPERNLRVIEKKNVHMHYTFLFLMHTPLSAQHNLL